MKNKKQKKKSWLSFIISKPFLLLVQLISSLVLFYLIYNLQILPELYLIILGVILGLLLIVSSAYMTSGYRRLKRDNKLARLVVSRMLSLFISVIMILGSVYIYRGNSFITNITGESYQTRVIGVYVLKNSSISQVKEIKGKTVGYSLSQSKAKTETTIKALKKAVGTVKTKEYDEYSDLSDALYKGKITAIVADQSYLSLLEYAHEGFADETKMIYKKEFKERLDSIIKNTNVTSKPFFVYITGIDTYGSVSTVSRSDVNLLMGINPNTEQILIISIPRDTQINLHSNGKMDKLTHSAMYGINETINTIEDFLGMDIDYYAKTNFSGITNIIDALGGVTVNSPYAFTTLHGKYKIVKGTNHLDGDQALCFVRERYALPNGDYDRGKNQQILLKAIIKKAISPTIIANYDQILSAIEGSFTTNMDSSQIKSLINMQLKKNINWKIYNTQVTGSDSISYKTYSQMGKRTYVSVPDKKVLKKIKALIDKIENSKKITESEVKATASE